MVFPIASVFCFTSSLSINFFRIQPVTIPTIMWLFLLLITIPLTLPYFFNRLKRWRTAKRFEREHGAQPPVKLADVAPPLGGSFYRETMRAFSERRLLELIRARHEAGGHTYRSQTLGSDVISTSEPENIKAVLATRFEDYSLGFRLAALGPLLGKGIFTTDAAEWEASRALVRPNFVKAQISDSGLFEKHVGQLLAHIPKDGSSFDLQDLFFKMSFDTSSELLFGQSVHSFTAAEDSEQARFVAAFDYASGELVRRLQLGPFLFLYFNKDFEKACKTAHDFVDGIIARAMADREKRDFNASEAGEGKSHHNFLQGLLNSVTDRNACGPSYSTSCRQAVIPPLVYSVTSSTHSLAGGMYGPNWKRKSKD